MDIASLSIEINTSDVAKAEADLDSFANSGKKVEQSTSSLASSTTADLGSAATTWKQFVAERMSDYMKLEGGHAGAMKRMSAEWQEYKKSLSAAPQALPNLAPSLDKNAEAMKLAGLSAGQYSQAMRLLPMQLTDVVTSLASGMPAWQVFIQQGGQVRDMFGGVGNAARAVVNAIGPVGIGMGTAAAAVGTLGAAYLKGAAEAQAYQQALILTGNAAGTSANALAEMARQMDSAGTTQRKAAAALAEVASTGKFAENQIKAISDAAIAMEESTGKAVSSAVKEFSALADAPAAASAKLNQQYHYLTASVYEQISALEDQGRKTEAAKVATDAYAEAIKTRSEQIVGNLGLLQEAWRGFGKAASEAWDAALDVGREKTLQQQIERTKALIEGRNTSLLARLFPDSLGPDSEDTKALKARLALLEKAAAANAKLTEEEGKRQAQEGANISAAEKARKAKEDLNKTYQDGITSLKEETALLGDNGKEAAVRYAIEYGALKELTDEQKQGYIAAAAAYDAKERGIQASKDQAAASKKATEEQKRENEAFQQLLDTLLPAEAASRKYTETIGKLDKQLAAGGVSLDQYQAAVESAWKALNNADWEKQNKALDEQNRLTKEADDKFKSLRDRIDPAAAAAEQYAKDQETLNQRLAKGNISAEEYYRLLGLLDQNYQKNSASSSEWAKFTERQLDRVDQAFSDAWLNIGHGFDSFSSGLKRAFEQMLAELAHMAITRPIMLQIGSALGIGGLTGSAMGTGIWGSLSGGSGVLGSLGGLYSAYKAGSGILGGITSAGKFIGSGASSMLSGLDSSIGTAVGKLLYGGASSYAPISFQLESLINRMGVSAASFAAKLGLSEQALAKFGAALGTVGDIASVAGAAYNVYGGFKEGIGNGLTTLAGAAIGAFFGGPVGSAIGSTIGKFVGGALFGTWKIKDYGLALGVNNGDLNPQSYVYKKKSGLLSHKKKTTYDPLGGDLAQQMQDTFASTEDSVSSLFEQLGYAIDQGTFDGLQIARSKISTKGKTQDEISKAIGDWFTQAGEGINRYLNATLGTGLSYDIAGMTTFVNDLYAVNGLLDHLNVGLFSTNVAGGKLVEELLGLTGGLDTLTTSVSTYYDQFFSDAEKQANTLADVTQAFADANQTLPATRAEYRAMVESIDLTTEAGRSMFATLMNLAGQADSYYDIVEQRAQAVQAATSGAAVSAAKGALSTLSSAIGAEQQRLSDAYNARVASINDRVGTANGAVSSLTAVGSSLDAALKQLAGSSEQATALLHEQAVATLRSALAFAKAGGSLAGFAGLQDALDSAGTLDSGRYSTLEDLQREQGRTANLIAQLQGVNGAQLTTEQRLLDSLQGQLDQAKASYDLQTSGLDAQLTAAQAQLDALLGIDSGVKSVADALSLFAGSMQQAQALQNANSSITSVTGLAGVKRQVASDGTILDEHGASMGLKVVGNQVVGTQSWNQDWRFNIGQDGQMSWAAGQQANIQEWARSQGIPGFATGGDFGGGLGMFGENGPELAVTGPMRVFNTHQTADILSGGGAATAQEIRNLRADMGQVFDALRAIAKHTMQTSKYTRFLEQFEADGMPAVRA